MTRYKFQFALPGSSKRDLEIDAVNLTQAWVVAALQADSYAKEVREPCKVIEYIGIVGVNKLMAR